MDEESIFSLEEIKKQLKSFGYNQIPKNKLDKFAEDLNTLAKHERQRNSLLSSSSTMTTPSIDPHDYILDGGDRDYYDDYDTRPQLSEITEEVSVPKRKSINIIGDKENFSYYKESADNNRGNINRYISKASAIAPSAGKPILKRKVLRKYNGESRVFDESGTESEAGSIITDERDGAKSAYTDRFRISNSAENLNRDRRSVSPNEAAKFSSDEQTWTDYPQSSVKVLPSFIRPSSTHPHTRNLKKTDPVATYHRYANEWRSRGVPGEKNHKVLRWQIREQLIQQYDPPKSRPHQCHAPNDYIVPTDKKRKALRWEIRAGMA
ncbi:Hydrolethalus syndrome protein 1-like protein [Trichoplax sp. H2]|uniref:Centriolar and ciliogenesis-associated protein HYLS1 C-terminal domain-containing protein n=1 Tax=Trichoplax adhaerens TaxID=10228 RepID=B3S0W9_TRIAD|nr:hypothetical protein TRIADDRAFT_57197 [Trichoplax adhaerens]EDV24077.1 hypothetical protein TRIADDRAFT_57197 [Trichoplax adhaerens]RDD44289.1 Hydrolethalus syndrome protein 1-like protein [Trichoplax sp. H2]|eukprot:XP_002113603.1 hypothetical protein TRIADDRAFT_57197 [Trichoplax adhaerens]